MQYKLFWMQYKLFWIYIFTTYQQTYQSTRVSNFWMSDKASSIHNYLRWYVRAPI